MTKILTKMSAVLFLCLMSFSCFAWNALGHMVIANIAYANLTPTAKTKVDSIVTSFSHEYPDIQNFEQLADWPDSLHSQRIEFYTHWHYIDNPISLDGTPTQNVIDTDNAVWAVNELVPVVKNNNSNVFERARSLAFLAHIVGDLHQPEHTVSAFSRAHPNGDKGGNSFTLGYQGQSKNAHAVWDEGVGVFEGDATQDQINQMTQTLTTLYPASSFGVKVKDVKPDDWQQEGIQNAQNFVYDTVEGKQVSSSYMTLGKQVAGQEAALAGYRLAALLNSLLS